MGWLGLASLGLKGFGAVKNMFGGGPSPEEQMALNQMKAQAERSNQFWQQAQGDINKSRSYFSPIAGGSRQSAFEAVAPEVQSATQRMEAGRKSLFNLASRSGGAATMMDPYAKANVATGILQQVRPQAASQMGQIGQTMGGWAAQNQAGLSGDMMNYAKMRKEAESSRGAAFFDIIQDMMKQLPDVFGKKKKTGSSPATYGPE